MLARDPLINSLYNMKSLGWVSTSAKGESEILLAGSFPDREACGNGTRGFVRHYYDNSRDSDSRPLLHDGH